MTIKITNPYRIAQVKHFAARAKQTPEEYVLEILYGMIDAEEYAEGKFIPSKEELEAALAAV